MLQQIMKLAADNATTQFGVLDRVTQNVANINTTGYKSTHFEHYMMPDGRLEGTDRHDYSKGDLRITNRQMDIGIDGYGFIPVTQPDGTTSYTRDGQLAVNSEGYIVTNHGDLVGTGFQVPPDYQKVFFKPDGTVLARITESGKDIPLGKLDLVRFINPEGLQDNGYNRLVPTADSGVPVKDNDSAIKQGMLESSNVSVFGEVDRVLRLNASIISNMRIIKFTDDIFRQAVNLRQ